MLPEEESGKAGCLAEVSFGIYFLFLRMHGKCEEDEIF